MVNVKNYPDKLYTLVNNMLLFHFDYQDILEQLHVTFPDIKITMDELLDIITQLFISRI